MFNKREAEFSVLRLTNTEGDLSREYRLVQGEGHTVYLRVKELC